MPAITVAPGLTITDDMYEAALETLARRLPDFAALTHDEFVTPTRWACIPDDQGHLSKAETVLTRSRHFTAKLNIWFREDLRGGQAPMPHNHPWDTFTSYVFAGGYDEHRWYLDPAGNIVEDLNVTHAGPTANQVGHDLYHEVAAVHEPGKTMSLMVCGAGRRGDWGYLDLETGAHRAMQPVKGFDAMFAALNPHLR